MKIMKLMRLLAVRLLKVRRQPLRRGSAGLTAPSAFSSGRGRAVSEETAIHR